MASKKLSEPRVHPFPAHVMFNAMLAGAREVGLAITAANPNEGVIWTETALSLASWGEVVTVFLRADSAQQTSVLVESKLKFGLFGWGAHGRNFERVHRSLDAGLRIVNR